ncbi:hypothetical protein [Microbacterium panaciterrae]|uniref:Uncharacterized protein n=1 Tax=Microbacterium panaciterrae TaxID=985759 RepID=A0ABP8PHU0_9MICO
MPEEAAGDGADRQRVVRVRGSRRAQLTAAPGTHAEPDERDREGPAAAEETGGPNDDRMRREVPPHY